MPLARNLLFFDRPTMSEEKKSKWQAIIDGLEAKDYVRVIVLSAFVIVGVIWYAFRADNQSNKKEIQRLNSELAKVERDLSRYYEKREDSLNNSYEKKLEKVNQRLDLYVEKDSKKDSIRIAQLEKKDKLEKRAVSSFRMEAIKTEKISKNIDGVTQNLEQ